MRDRLLNRVQATQRVFARKTTARPIAAEEAIAFLDEHHLWGPSNAKYADAAGSRTSWWPWRRSRSGSS